MTVTNEMLRRQFAKTVEVSRQYMITQNKENSTPLLDTKISTSLSVANIVKVKGSTVYTNDGLTAELFNPMPCLFWKCTGTPDKNGVITLQKPLRGLFIHDGDDVYCLGVTGASDEFEVRFHVGENEVRLNDLFLNMKAKSIVINGLEEYKNE